MTKVGGKREGAGRKPGSRNIKSKNAAVEAAKEGITPVEYMLNIMRDENEEPGRRSWAAEKAAPFIHPRPAPVVQPIILDLQPVESAEDVKAAIARVIEASTSGEISAAEGSSLISIIEAQRRAIEAYDLFDRVAALEELQNCRAR